MFETTQFSESLLVTHLIVDVRTPLEYGEDHIPGAVNVPLLSNEERVVIGIIHKKDGPLAARQRGLALTAGRFPAIIAAIADHANDRPILVYCWRGGLRSKTVTAILELTGYQATQLTGGYKAYRNRVATFFSPFQAPGRLIVLHGLTGVGKTTLLHLLAERGHATVDLEGLARHRGSAFGALGLNQSLSQKSFESHLWQAFRSCPAGQPIIVEGESRRIGALSLPGNLYEVMREGIKIWCDASLKTRVARLIAEYGKEEYREGMAAALRRISKKLGAETHRELTEHLERWDLEPFMAGLLKDYYDRVYYKTKSWQEDLQISLEIFPSAVAELEQFIHEQQSGHSARHT